ncbi:MAG: selenide, water dikinase SelD [Planctomycetes bacterium]|nr:selenide, water dikinase SelD [Planctomycetota bacterium]
MRQVAPLAVGDNVVLGPGGYDDVGAVRSSVDGKVTLHTVDFFPPVVDDAFAYGAIAAANSLSDIYASGGKPSVVLNLAGFPKDWGSDVLEQVFAGAVHVVEKSGAKWIGGHSVQSAEPLYGFACFGECDESDLISNEGAAASDLLFITKPLGAGSITTSVKRDIANQVHVDAAVAGMMRLNDGAAHAMKAAGVCTATDITGFGLMGHAFNIARASNVVLRFNAADIPLYDGALALAEQGVVSGASKRGRDIYGPNVSIGEGVSQAVSDICFDAETSGGVLVCVKPNNVDAFRDGLGVDDLFVQVGEVVDGEAGVCLV